MYLAERTGRGVRIAVVDSGIYAAHPHVGGISAGFGIAEDGTRTDDFVDRLGHGTAVAAAIREKAPDAELVAIKIFRRSLASDAPTLVSAIDAALDAGADVINLSLGTANEAHRPALAAAVARARARHALIVAAPEDDGVRHWPGSLDGVVAVVADWKLPREGYRVVVHGGRAAIAASAYPREIPGVPPERNLKGVSFAVANASAFVARAREASPGATADRVLDLLMAAAI
jgi:subtilisin family serine protease